MAKVRNSAQKATWEQEKKSRTLAVRAAVPNATHAAVAAQTSPDKPLTEKQRAFAVAYARGESVPNAMARAGYNETPSYGYRMLHMPNVRAVIDAEKALYAAAAQMDRKRVIDMHLEAFEMAKLISEPSSMVAAAREIGKICGLYEPRKVDITLNGSVQHEVHRFEGMSDAELLKVIAESAQPAQPTLEAP